MKKLILFSFILLSFASCSKDEPENFTSSLQLHIRYADADYQKGLIGAPKCPSDESIEWRADRR